MGRLGAQSVKRPTSAQVMISRLVGLSPGIGLCADSSEPEAYFGFCVSTLCPSPTHARALSLSLKYKIKLYIYIYIYIYIYKGFGGHSPTLKDQGKYLPC